MSKADSKQPETEPHFIPCAHCGLPALELSADAQWVKLINRHHGKKEINHYPTSWLIEWLAEKLKAAGSNVR